MIHLAPVAAVAAAVTALRWALARGRLTREDVAQAWRQSFPGDHVSDSVVSRDGRVALVQTDWGAGVVCRNGRMARRLDGALVEAVHDGLAIRFEHDITAPRLHLTLDPADAARWQERIEEA